MHIRLLAAAVAALLLVPAADAGAAAGKKSRCPDGKVPVTASRGKKVTVKRDRRGRIRCKRIAVPRPPAPAPTPLGQAAATTDALRRAVAADPAVLAPLQRAVGRRRASRLLDVALDGWRGSAGVARASAAPATTTFTVAKGISGSASFGVDTLDGAESGLTAKAGAEISATREGLDGLDPELKSKLPPDVTGAKGKVDLQFEDRLTRCADKTGKAPGKVKASGKVTVTVERGSKPPIVVELGATVETGYVTASGADGKVTSIDSVDTRTTFTLSVTGESTQTYRGRRVGSGFGRESILDAAAGSGALERDFGKFDTANGSVSGPKGTWNWKRGVGLSDLRSIDNIKGMFATSIATDLLMLAALEYVRKKVIERAEKEKCGGPYTVTLDVSGRGAFATHDTSGLLQSTVITTAAPGEPGRFTGSAPSGWANLVYSPRDTGCPYIPQPGTGLFSVVITPAGDDAIQVTWTTDLEGGRALAAVDCPPDGQNDPPPIPGQPGPSLLGIAPTTFQLPLGGGRQELGGGFADGGEGWFNDGAITVSPSE